MHKATCFDCTNDKRIVGMLAVYELNGFLGLEKGVILSSYSTTLPNGVFLVLHAYEDEL